MSMLALLPLLTLAACDQRGRLEGETALMREQLARDDKELRELHARLLTLNPPGQFRNAGPAELQRAKDLVASLVKDKERLEQECRNEEAQLKTLQTQLEDYQIQLNRRNP
jgi:chromosome segregation ATPase